MTRVAGLDLALRASGYCDPTGRCTTVSPLPRLDGYHRHLDASHRLALLIAADRPDLVIVEGYVPGKFATSMVRSAEFGGIVRAMLTQASIRFVEVKPSSLKKFATGSGASKKPAMIAAAVAAGADLSGATADDEADAWLLRAAGLAAIYAEQLWPGPIPPELAHLAAD